MADDETPETTDETTAAPETAAEETPVAEAPAEAQEAPAEEAPAEEPVAQDAPAEETPAAQPAAPAEPVAQLTPKERKAASRARRGPRRPATPEERDALRKEKAKARSRRRVQEREKAKAARPDEAVAPTAPTHEHGPGRPKVRQGVVVSDKADKTITVRVDSAKRHRKYQKIVRSSQTLHAHDERNDAHAGDTVKVIESRPLSRTKRWRLVEILERAK